MTFSDKDIFYMNEALREADKAFLKGEVPVGAVIVKDDKIIASAHNMREGTPSAISHAECEAILRACKEVGDWRLSGCKMYVTLEPCPMCAGAIISSRLDAVYYGAEDESVGAVGSVINMFDMPFGHRPRIYKGLLMNECAKKMGDFFTKVRKLKK